MIEVQERVLRIEKNTYLTGYCDQLLENCTAIVDIAKERERKYGQESNIHQIIRLLIIGNLQFIFRCFFNKRFDGI